MTLLESLVVIAILAMIGTMGVVQLQHALRVYTLRQAASEVTADIKVARGYSIRSGQSVGFYASDDGTAYGWGPTFARRLPDGVTVQVTGSPVMFNGDGSSSGGDVTLVSGTIGRIIAIDPATGAAMAGAR
jgi:type II secretory pathway pseudopilin PulG